LLDQFSKCWAEIVSWSVVNSSHCTHKFIVCRPHQLRPVHTSIERPPHQVLEESHSTDLSFFGFKKSCIELISVYDPFSNRLVVDAIYVSNRMCLQRQPIGYTERDISTHFEAQE
jgi:hypothetical protein